MTKTIHADAPILVVSDNVGDAALVKQLLESEFGNVQTSTKPDLHVDAFDNRPADVLVLAFNGLEKSQAHYLGLYRQSRKIHLKPHRTIILCGKDDVRQAYGLCRKELFDDYMLFWPLTHDSPRLLMSVHLALRELAALKDTGPTAVEFAAQARHLASLEGVVEQHMAQGDARIQNTMQVVARAEEKVGAALDGFSRRIAKGELSEVLDVKNMAGLEREIVRLKQEEIQQPLRAAGKAIAPLAQWTREFRTNFEPHLEAARSLSAMADHIRPTLLVVDDDDMQRKMIATLLKSENYSLIFAVSGLDALSLLRKVRPDVILMDIMMPELDGLETTRRLKSIPGLANVPVIMSTGRSEGSVVIDSMNAGASGFVVKPFDRTALVAKLMRALQTSRAKAPAVER